MISNWLPKKLIILITEMSTEPYLIAVADIGIESKSAIIVPIQIS